MSATCSALVTSFRRISAERYDQALNVLPPRCWVRLGFLLCEPYSDKVCAVTGKYLPNYRAYVVLAGQHFESVGHVTVPEWRRMTGADVLASVAEVIG